MGSVGGKAEPLSLCQVVGQPVLDHKISMHCSPLPLLPQTRLCDLDPDIALELYSVVTSI